MGVVFRSAAGIVATLLLLAITYFAVRAVESIERLDGRMEKLSECTLNTHPLSTREIPLSSPDAVSKIAQASEQEVHSHESLEKHIERIEALIEELGENLAASSAARSRNFATESIPSGILSYESIQLEQPSLNDMPPSIIAISEQYRADAEVILQEYATLAREAIEAEHANGTLDWGTMERIKRETLTRTTEDLSARLPPQIMLQMFPGMETSANQ